MERHEDNQIVLITKHWSKNCLTRASKGHFLEFLSLIRAALELQEMLQCLEEFQSLKPGILLSVCMFKRPSIPSI